MILDGFGCNPHQNEVNAIKEAHPENFKYYWENYPHAILEASGEPVGLPDGQMGNSEVGHLNIGAGRVVYQPLVQISKDVRDGDIEKKPSLVNLYTETKNSGKALHLSGLLSDGGVHSHINHLIGLVKMAKNFGIEKVYIHAILDGRDTEPTSGIGYVKRLEVALEEIGVGKIATVSGRFFQMDRDKRWDRVEKAYNALVNRVGEHAATAIDCVEKSYLNGINDEFLLPTIIDTSGMDQMNDGDGFLFFNYRPDRAREITKVLTDKTFKEFDTSKCPTLNYVCMTQYDETFPLPVVYAPESLTHTFGEIIADKGMNQLRIAETEKYAHVTFFFNGGIEVALKNEDRVLVNSPKVATYDLQPEMSARELTDKLLHEISKDKYDVIILNYANPDMVGHTGILSAAVEAIKVVDKCVKEVVDAILEKEGAIFLTADHGNADLMVNPESGEPWTAHSTNPVPFVLIANNAKEYTMAEHGKLADIAPTMLKYMNMDVPSAMTGDILISK